MDIKLRKSKENAKFIEMIDEHGTLLGVLRPDKYFTFPDAQGFTLTLGNDVGLLLVNILHYARKYADKYGGAVRVDGEQYIHGIHGDILHPFRDSLKQITNIYVNMKGHRFISTILEIELKSLRSQKVPIEYAPLNYNPVSFKRKYMIYRIFDDLPALIHCRQAKSDNAFTPWLIVDIVSCDLSKLKIKTLKNSYIDGMAVEDIGGGVDFYTHPDFSQAKIRQGTFHLHVAGNSSGILNTKYHDLCRHVDRQIVLSGVDTVFGLSVDIDFLNVLRSVGRYQSEKDKYRHMIKVVLQNEDAKNILPFWTWVNIWGSSENESVVSVKCRESDHKYIKIKDLCKYIDDAK